MDQGMRLMVFIFVLISYSSINAQIDSGYVDISSGKLFYRVWGEGDPLIVFTGGIDLSSKGFEIYADRLSDIRKVILFDRRGSGRSIVNRNAPITLDAMVRDVEALRKQLSINRWDVIAEGFGATLALHYIHRYADHVGQIVLSSAYGPGAKSSTQKFKEPNPEDLTENESLIALLLQEELDSESPSADQITKYRKALRTRFLVSKSEVRHQVYDWYLNEVKIGRSPAIFPRKLHRLKKIDHEVLILHGLGDFIGLKHPQHNQDIFKNSKLVIIEDAGHLLFFDSPDRYFTEIRGFLNAIDTGL